MEDAAVVELPLGVLCILVGARLAEPGPMGHVGVSSGPPSPLACGSARGREVLGWYRDVVAARHVEDFAQGLERSFVSLRNALRLVGEK